MGKKILAALAGIVTAFVTVFIIESIGHLVYPPPPDLDMTDMAAMAEYVKTLPTGAIMFVLFAWITATFVGGWVACIIAKNNSMLFAGIVGFVILAASIFNLMMLPHPTWFAVSAIAGILLATFLAAKIGAANKPATA